jgi:ribonuclease BN (tRNA processing enzyme)
MQDANVKVTSALVDHPPVSPAFDDRFDCPDRSIVNSGDTRPSENLVRLARGADGLTSAAGIDGKTIDANADQGSNLSQGLTVADGSTATPHYGAWDAGRFISNGVKPPSFLRQT